MGYVRVSTLDQNDQRQLEGQVLDQVFTDRASGKDTVRPKLEELIRFARAGDTVVVHYMDRLARNLDDLRSVVQTLTGKGARVEFVKEGLVFTGEDSPMANLMLSVMGAFAEFERSLNKERQREGIALAKIRGVYKERKRALGPEKIEELVARAAAGVPKTQLAREYEPESGNGVPVSQTFQPVGLVDENGSLVPIARSFSAIVQQFHIRTPPKTVVLRGARSGVGTGIRI